MPTAQTPKGAARLVRDRFWPKLRQVASRIPFVEDVLAAYYCATDRDTPLRVRGTLLAALAYFIVPTDMIPDVLAGFGFTDDAAVIATALTMVGAHIKDIHRERARRALAEDIEILGE